MRNRKGFTLLEMLIVVAIIAILISIAIPAFSNQLEKAREASDLANIRNAYAQLFATVELDFDKETWMKKNTAGDGYYTVYVKVTQKKGGWQIYGDAKYVQLGDDGYIAGVNSSKKVSKYYKLNYYFTPQTVHSALQKQAGISGVLIRFSGEMNDDDDVKTGNGKYVYP